MLGVIGIVGCVIVTAVAACVAAAATIATCVIQGVAAADAADAARDQKNMELEAQDKMENSRKADSAIAARQHSKNAARLRAQMGSAIATDHLKAKRMRFQNANKKVQFGTASKSTSSGPKPVQNYGKPTVTG